MDPAALNLTTTILGHGRFLFVQLEATKADGKLLRSLTSLGQSLENAHFLRGNPPEEMQRRGLIQYLRAEPGVVRQGELEDEGMSRANVLIRLEGTFPESLTAYEKELCALIRNGGGKVHTRGGIQKPRSYTSYAMTQFAYAPAHAPATGGEQPLAVVTPQIKVEEWWKMDWMRRESFFLPRFDEAGRMLARGHTFASAAAIPCVTRRLYHHPEGYGLGSGYDFVGYFEFAEEVAHIFRSVMEGLRDPVQNPEWKFVREGPEWWGRRVAYAEELWQ